MDSIMGISSRRSTNAGAIKEGIGKATRVATSWNMLGNVLTAIQPILSTIPKSALATIRE